MPSLYTGTIGLCRAAEAIPFLGVAVLIADTGYELYAACETMRDLDELYLELGLQEEASGDAIHTVCNPPPHHPGRLRATGSAAYH